MKTMEILEWRRNGYESVRFPRIERLRDLFDVWNWRREVVGSFPDGLSAVWNNAMVFLSPWFRTRRNMVATFYNCNGAKLLKCSRRYAMIRTSGGGEDTIYYILSCGLMRATLYRRFLIDHATGRKVNMFMISCTR